MAKFSKTVSAGSRIYYFDAHTDSLGNDYLCFTELNLRNKKRACIYIHSEDFRKILKAFNKTIKHINNGKKD